MKVYVVMVEDYDTPAIIIGIRKSLKTATILQKEHKAKTGEYSNIWESELLP